MAPRMPSQELCATRRDKDSIEDGVLHVRPCPGILADSAHLAGIEVAWLNPAPEDGILGEATIDSPTMPKRNFKFTCRSRSHEDHTKLLTAPAAA